jgi:hypothetical protein
MTLLASILILGALTMPQSESPLVLEAESGVADGEFRVTARFRNKGKAPCVVVVDDYFCRTETQLYDEKGTALTPRDARAVQGMRLPPNRVAASTLKPGAAVEVMTFSLIAGHARAMAGDLSWELQDFSGQTLKVRFTCSFPKENVAAVEKLGAAGAVSGEWTSPKVDVPTTKLTQKQMDNVLSGRRSIRDAGAIPMLVKALDRKDEVIREYAVESLGALKAATAAKNLAEVLLKDPARGVRIHAARALGELAVPDVREALTTAAREDSDSLVRTLCEEALTKLPR